MDTNDHINLIKDDIPLAMKLIGDITQSLKNTTETGKRFLKRIEDGEIVTKKGLSFLELKNQLILDYLQSSLCVTATKLFGESILGHPAIESSVETRTVIERMRPIEKRLQYQIDKIKREAMGLQDDDPMRLKANIAGLQTDKPQSQDDEKSGLYVAPKINPVHYSGDFDLDRKRQLLERAKQRALETDVISEMRRQYLNEPEEISEGDTRTGAQRKFDQERREFEEDNFTRLRVTNKNKKSLKRKANDDLSEVAQLDSLRIFYDQDTKLGELAHRDERRSQKKQKVKAMKLRGEGKRNMKKGKGKKFKIRMK